jgi:hypothetical protein
MSYTTGIARPDVLQRAWEHVRGNKGAAGMDGETLDAIEAYGVGRMLTELRELLEAGRYRPQAVRRVYIAKPGRPNERRPLGIPRVRDRVVQTAAKLVLEPIFEASFSAVFVRVQAQAGGHPCVGGHPHGSECRGAVGGGRRFCRLLRKPGPRLPLEVGGPAGERPQDAAADSDLATGVCDGGRGVVASMTGVPQGGSISPLLSNIYGHALDALWAKEASHLGKIVRYADDRAARTPKASPQGSRRAVLRETGRRTRVNR